jgi:hypothetical protein
MSRPTLYVGHAPTPPLADEAAGYSDFFSGLHRNEQPIILVDRTSVKWPANCTPELAAIWRKARGLVRPVAKRVPVKRKRYIFAVELRRADARSLP